jgi:cytochrome P450
LNLLLTNMQMACRDLIAIKNPFIKACIDRATSQLKNNNNEPTNVMEAMVVEGHDFDYIANQCRHLIIAGFETTSALLGFSFALLERHSDVFKKLRDSVIETFGSLHEPREEITFETLKGCKYLQYVLNETLRLYPAGPSIQRVAVRDTVLPRSV